MFNINSRRYIGSKTKLLEEIKKHIEPNTTVADIFGGTGIVGASLVESNKIILNDLLYSNFISYSAFMGKRKISKNEIEKYIKKLNSLKSEDNYVSKHFGNKYFSYEVAKKIGVIREYIENNIKDKDLKNILIVSLLYSMDRYANTVGHYEMYLKNTKKFKENFILKPINLEKRGSSAIFFSEDANKLIKKIKGDILYLDPPYNARQYINFYHVWENIAKWEKPELKWESKKFDRSGMKSKYSSSSAYKEMKKLLIDAKNNFKKVIVSYNNTYNANSAASNNKIKYEEMIKLLSMFGKLKIVEMDHKYFNSGKTKFTNHKEYLFISTRK